MKAVFLEDVVIDDNKHRAITIDKGEVLSAEDNGNSYILRKSNGWGTVAPKSAEGTIYRIEE